MMAPQVIQADLTLIEGCFEADDYAILAEHQPIGTDPTTVRAQHPMVGRASEPPAVLQHQRHAFAFALRDHLALVRHRERLVAGRREQSHAPGVG